MSIRFLITAAFALIVVLAMKILPFLPQIRSAD